MRSEEGYGSEVYFPDGVDVLEDPPRDPCAVGGDLLGELSSEVDGRREVNMVGLGMDALRTAQRPRPQRSTTPHTSNLGGAQSVATRA